MKKDAKLTFISKIMKFLYLDTTTNETAIKVFGDSGKLISVVKWEARFNQSEELLPAIDKALDSKIKDLAGIFVNTGYGSYTGVRVGLTTANFLGLSLNIQPVGVNNEKEIVFRKAGVFKQAVLPQYENEPHITKEKSRR